MSEESPQYGASERSAFVSSNGSGNPAAAARHDGETLSRDADISPLTPYYQDAYVAIYHANCRDLIGSIEQPGSPIDLLLTDPPYGIRERTKRATAGRGQGKNGFKSVRSRDWMAVTGDDRPFNPGHLLCFPKMIIWGANHFCEHLDGSPRWLVWDKREETGSDDNADCEIAWTNLKGPARIHRQLWRGICKRGEENVSKGYSMVHPTQKPIALMRWCIGLAGECRTIIDPYMGSGTTLRAAKDLGKRAIGIEIEEHYCEIAAKRMQQEVLNLAGSDADFGVTDSDISSQAELLDSPNDGSERSQEAE